MQSVCRLAQVALVGQRTSGIGYRGALFCELDDCFGAGTGDLAFDLSSQRDCNALGTDAAAQPGARTNLEFVIYGNIPNHSSCDDCRVGAHVAFPLSVAGDGYFPTDTTVALDHPIDEQCTLGFDVTEQASILGDKGGGGPKAVEEATAWWLGHAVTIST